MLYNWHIRLPGGIDRSRRDPLHSRIVKAIIRDIETGRLASEAWLPSSRYPGKTLGFNRKTVVLAYEHLIAQDWPTSLGTRGTTVAAGRPGAPKATLPPRPRPFGGGYRFRKPLQGRASYRFAPAALGASLAPQEKDQA